MPNPVCSACGETLSDPDESVLKPDEDPEDKPNHHFKVVDGEKGQRFQCVETGQMAKPAAPDEGGGSDPKSKEPQGGGTGAPKNQSESGGGGQPKQSPPTSGGSGSPSKPSSQPVYEDEGEQSAMDVLEGVVTQPTYDLNDAQIAEIKDWAEIYDGQLPPNLLEEILGNLSGVSKQTAQLVGQKYEAKLNRWVREKSKDDGGPPLGALPNIPGSTPSSGQNLQQRKRQLKKQKARKEMSSGGGGEPPPQEDTDEEPDLNLSEESNPSERPIKKRQDRAFERRNDAIDAAIEQAAPEMAREMTSRMGQGYDLIFTLLKSKAKKDPDWFFEKMEQFDMDVMDEFMEPSEAMRQESQAGSGQGRPNDQIDSILDDMSGGSQSQPSGDQDMRGGPPTPEPAGSTGPDRQDDAPTNPEPGNVEEKTNNDGPHWKDENNSPDDEPLNEETDDELDELMAEVNGED